MSCKARDAAQGGPLCKERAAADRPASRAPQGLHAKGPAAVLRALRVVPLRVCGARLAAGPFACNRGRV